MVQHGWGWADGAARMGLGRWCGTDGRLSEKDGSPNKLRQNISAECNHFHDIAHYDNRQVTPPPPDMSALLLSWACLGR